MFRVSAAMMLRYSFSLADEADCIEKAVDKVLEEGWRTADLWHEGFKKADTKTMTQAVIANL